MNLETYKQRFLTLTGLSDINLRAEKAGPETFLRFAVGRDAPFYRSVLATIDKELHVDDPYHGRLSLSVEPNKHVLASLEVELLRSLISRSLRVTSERALDTPRIEFVPFRGGEEHQIIQPTNQAILGRRGVGKSSLILIANHRVIRDGSVPVWLDLQPYSERRDAKAVLEILRELCEAAKESALRYFPHADVSRLSEAGQVLERLGDRDVTQDQLRSIVPQLKTLVRRFSIESGHTVFIFLDDAHLVGWELQPFLFGIIHSVLKGGGGWLKIAGVRNLLKLYDSESRVGLQYPHDVQLIPLDLTLVDPASARDHLTGILQKFLSACGLRRISETIVSRAIDRLVWCSAGVPRDFLLLFERSISFALQHRRKRVGVQEANLAVGESGQLKMTELEQDTGGESATLKSLLNALQTVALDEYRSNSFLIRQDPNNVKYGMLLKLVDLRLIHLIHPSITPETAGERYEAYLLDFSFYTGLRRRHGISELKIAPNEPPKYSVLRKLPRIDLSTLALA